MTVDLGKIAVVAAVLGGGVYALTRDGNTLKSRADDLIKSLTGN